MAGQDNAHIARETFAAWNAHDTEAFIKRLAPGVVWESVTATYTGHEGARAWFKVYVSACPDLHLDIEQVLASGESNVVVRWRFTGTHLGPLAELAATGRKATNHGCTVFEIKNGKVVHAWMYSDNAHLLRQLGALSA